MRKVLLSKILGKILHADNGKLRSGGEVLQNSIGVTELFSQTGHVGPTRSDAQNTCN